MDNNIMKKKVNKKQSIPISDLLSYLKENNLTLFKDVDLTVNIEITPKKHPKVKK
jgi:hypothetical protein